jgi:hypothetical protein
MKRKVLIVVFSIVSLGLLAFAYAYFNSHKTPAGQVPLSDLTAQRLETFRIQFNAAKDRTRIILLLSPT